MHDTDVLLKHIVLQIHKAVRPRVIKHVGYYTFVCTPDFLTSWKPHFFQRSGKLPADLINTIRSITIDCHEKIPQQNIEVLATYLTEVNPHIIDCLVAPNRIAINFMR